MSVDDVTSEVNASIGPATAAAEAGSKQRANMSQIELNCNKATGLRCDVVTLYSGAVYQLYRYKKYTDVRLVFVPEHQDEDDDQGEGGDTAADAEHDPERLGGTAAFLFLIVVVVITRAPLGLGRGTSGRSLGRRPFARDRGALLARLW